MENSERKEGLTDVGGHCSGGLPANNARARGLAPASITAFQASVQKGDYPPHAGATPPASYTPVTKAPVVVLSAALARCDGPIGGPVSPAGGGIRGSVSPVRIPIAHKKSGRDALNVPA